MSNIAPSSLLHCAALRQNIGTTPIKLDVVDVAPLLFFTRAAVEEDQALASSVLEAPFLPTIGRLWFQRPSSVTPPLTIANLYRLWNSDVASQKCPRCGSRMLLLDSNGSYGGTSFCGFVNYYCPFCREKEGLRLKLSVFKELEHLLSHLGKKHPATNPELPIFDALVRLGELRAADLLDPMHPLETASLNAAGIFPPVLTGHPEEAVMEAQALRLLLSPEVRERVRSLVVQTKTEQAWRVAEVEAELESLRGGREKPGPKFLFNSGALSLKEYMAIVKQKRELNALIDPDILRHELEERLIGEMQVHLGRLLTKMEQDTLINIVADFDGLLAT